MKRRTLTEEERRTIFDKTGGRCAYCGKDITIKSMRVDHVTPVSHGGSNKEKNLLPACKFCDETKGDMNLEMFRNYIAKLPNRLTGASRPYRCAERFGVIVPNPKPILFHFEQSQVHD